jgi:hypothetical protein
VSKKSIKVPAKFTSGEKAGRKWEYAKLELKAPRGWAPFHEYNWGPSMTFDKNKVKIVLRREKKS